MLTKHLAPYILILTLTALMLTSCAMGPDYTRPGVPTPESFRMGEKEGESIANLAWWELLRDEELQMLVRIALVENKDLQQAVASVEEFQARLDSRANRFPSASRRECQRAGLGRFNQVNIPGFPTFTSYYLQGNLTGNWISGGGSAGPTKRLARDLLAREENRRAVILALVSGVAQAYFDLRQLDMQLDIAKRTLQSWEESVKIAQARLRQGLIPKLDADQFEAERANAAARSAELERQMIQKENELSVLLGRNPRAIPRGQLLTEQMMPPEVPAGLPSELLQRRPDILQSERAAGRGDRQDRRRSGQPVSANYAYRNSGRGESPAQQSDSVGLKIRRRRFRPGGSSFQRHSPWIRTARRRSPSQAGLGPIREDRPRRLQGSRGRSCRGPHAREQSRGASKPRLLLCDRPCISPSCATRAGSPTIWMCSPPSAVCSTQNCRSPPPAGSISSRSFSCTKPLAVDGPPTIWLRANPSQPANKGRALLLIPLVTLPTVNSINI